jgi:signal transduction histidine kinase
MAKQPRTVDADPLRPRLVVMTAGIGLLATLAVFAFPNITFAYYSPPFHVALETAAGLTAALAAFLFFGRLREQRRQSNWALVFALALSAVVNIGFGVIPAVVSGASGSDFAVWATALGRTIGAGIFVFAAYAREDRVTTNPHIALSVIAAPLLSGAVIALVVWGLLPFMPAGLLVPPVIADVARPMADVHPIVMLIQVLGLGLYTAAAFGFIRRSERTGDELMRWLAAGAMLAACSRLHYTLYPSLYSGWIYSGDILRLGFYGLLLAGAVGEIRRYWQGLALAAAADERRRIARDLHDGLAQELAFITAQTRWLRLHDGDGETARSLAAAADRALDESRRAIAALTRDDDEPFDVALAQAAEEVADRVGTTVKLDLEPGAQLDPDVREGVLRIAREAIANAGRHSGAECVHVSLTANGRVLLRVSDDGVGFDPKNTRPDRYGLISMRERAQALDAEFMVTTAPGRGTSVEVAL